MEGKTAHEDDVAQTATAIWAFVEEMIDRDPPHLTQDVVTAALAEVSRRMREEWRDANG